MAEIPRHATFSGEGTKPSYDTYSLWTNSHPKTKFQGMTESDLLILLGARIRALRKARGLSQEAFAAECGLDRTYVGGIERGERNVAIRNLALIAKGLGISMSELLSGL
jgi:ribosome-binding protein aMBF1 (putative translation factor)